jgi:UDPglucose 6-dehydrogenase
MNITVIGSGYVGLVVGTCLADAGNQVECVDIDENKVKHLQNAQVPFFEPGLSGIVARNVKAKRLTFTTDVQTACSRGSIIFIAVGTPQGDDGSAELKYVYTVAEEIADSLSQSQAGAQVKGLKIILTKSTVPIGTSDHVHHIISQKAQHPFVVCSNPEFLKEGDAVNDFLKPDRIILGVPSNEQGQVAEQVIRRLYSSFYRTRERLHVMNVRSSEMTKYAANAMLATKISFMNELALLAEKVGADIEKVRTGIGSDPRIGYSFLFAGTGYGGSCFPKDVKALSYLSQQQDQKLHILEAVDRVNQRQKRILFDKAMDYFQGDLKGKTFGVWGLAFKPRTDDMREAPSLTLIKHLIEQGAKIKAYDPEAMESAAWILADEIQSGNLQLCSDHYQCADASDALFIVTEWRVFHHPNFERLAELLNNKVIFDGRNLYHPQNMREIEWTYFGIGRGDSIQNNPNL